MVNLAQVRCAFGATRQQETGRCSDNLPLHRPIGVETADKLLDAGQDALLIAREGPVIRAIELDEFRLRDVAGEMPTGVDANGAIAATVEHQGRSGDRAQEMPHIGVAQRL